jgi:hypothetical protein
MKQGTSEYTVAASLASKVSALVAQGQGQAAAHCVVIADMAVKAGMPADKRSGFLGNMLVAGFGGNASQFGQACAKAEPPIAYPRGTAVKSKLETALDML